MVEQQLRRRNLRDRRVLVAMGLVPRHEFVSAAEQSAAYADDPLPIGWGQTISQPYMVAAMCEALALTGTERVLEVGAGCGYHAAVLAELAGEVITIESLGPLAALARSNLARLGYDRVTVIEGDGSLGYAARAPYQAISVAAGAPEVPPALLDQLDAEQGRLVIPVGDIDEQELRLLTKRHGQVATRVVCYCRFVPLRGAQAWRAG